MCRNSVVNVVEIEKESISTTVTTLLRRVYDHMETRLYWKIKKLIPAFYKFYFNLSILITQYIVFFNFELYIVYNEVGFIN